MSRNSVIYDPFIGETHSTASYRFSITSLELLHSQRQAQNRQLEDLEPMFFEPQFEIPGK